MFLLTEIHLQQAIQFSRHERKSYPNEFLEIIKSHYDITMSDVNFNTIHCFFETLHMTLEIIVFANLQSYNVNCQIHYHENCVIEGLLNHC